MPGRLTAPTPAANAAAAPTPMPPPRPEGDMGDAAERAEDVKEEELG